MRLQTSSENISSVDRAIGFSLAAFSMFVVGYTATRVYLSQPQSQNAAPANPDFVIPHEATLWSDLGG
ncbi:MAG: hypothetical protein QNJ53_22915 [Pleurocapsa sp. MO_192.B19]|nr:hypothetical protein [Pleurocapsa sp. MO_192.B19]